MLDAIQRWCERAGIKGGALFRRVRLRFDGSVYSVSQRSLHANSVTLVYAPEDAIVGIAPSVAAREVALAERRSIHQRASTIATAG